MPQLLENTFADNTVQQWLIATLAALATMVGLRTVLRFVIRRLVSLAERTATEWDDVVSAVLEKTKIVFLMVVGVYVGSQLVTLPDRVRDLIGNTTAIALLVQAGIWAGAALTGWLQLYRTKQLSEDPAAVTTVSALGFVGKLVLWVVVLLLSLDNLGVDVTALVAGLGVGGIAVALAAQKILGDLFASLSIVLDKPFVLGDFLKVGEMLGSVEHIGLKTTRVRSLSGEQIVFSNADLLDSRIQNFGRMFERRAVFLVGVTYQTPREKLERIPGMIREAIEAQADTRFDRSHFKRYADSALEFETVYYVTRPEYNTYMDIQQAINLTLYQRFASEGIEFAYPTQTIYMAREVD